MPKKKVKGAAKEAATKKAEQVAEQMAIANNLHSALDDKTVRVICPQAGYLWRNRKGCVQKASGDNVTVLLADTKTCRADFPASEVWQLTGKEKPPLPAVLDFRKVLLIKKLQALQASGNQLQFAADRDARRTRADSLVVQCHSQRVAGRR